MSIAFRLRDLLRSGIHRIGELELQIDVYGYPYAICHHLDWDLCSEPAFGGIPMHEGPADARDLSTYAEDGTYRFTKSQPNLKRGWVIALEDEEDLRLAVDQFYPAAVGLYLAWKDGALEVENLREKLNRQTGMYRFARTISDEGAQKLVREIYGPDKACAQKILWQIDADTPLEDSEASRYTGIIGGLPETEAIPLLCREPSNHLVAECRKAAKAEFEAKETVGS